MVILDVMSIASGFVIRAVAGGVVIGVPVSPWLIICTFLLALFLGFSKRRHELVLLEGARHGAPRSAARVQPVLPRSDDRRGDRFDRGRLRDLHGLARGAEKLGTDKLYLTIPFVLFGIFRYLYLVHQREEGGNPTQLLLTDRPLLVGRPPVDRHRRAVLYWR